MGHKSTTFSFSVSMDDAYTNEHLQTSTVSIQFQDTLHIFRVKRVRKPKMVFVLMHRGRSPIGFKDFRAFRPA